MLDHLLHAHRPGKTSRRSSAVESSGFSQRAAGANARRPATPRRQRPGPRARRARPPARARARGDDRHHGLRQQRADAAGHDLPARLHDQADHGGRRHDPRGGMPGQARRSGRRMAAGAEGPPGPADDREPARRHGAREAPDHAARPAHVSIGLRRGGLPLADVSPAAGDGGGTAAPERMAVRRHTRRVHEAPGQPPARASTGRAMAVPHGRRDPGRADRSRLGHVAGRLPSRAHLRAARDDGHRLPGPGGEARPAPDLLRDGYGHRQARRPGRGAWRLRRAAARLRIRRRRARLDGRRPARLRSDDAGERRIRR